MGDCEDYVLLKRHELIRAGFHPFEPADHGGASAKRRRARGAHRSHGSRRFHPRQSGHEGPRLARHSIPVPETQSTANAGKWVDIIDTRRNVAQNF
jgi:hypothetical protein